MSAEGDRQTGGSSGGAVSFSFSYKELLATGLVGAFLAFLASKWHVPGVLLGALSPMASAVIMAIVKAYLSGTAMGGARLPGLMYILGAFWWFASRGARVRQAILFVGLRAGLASTVISASIVAGTQAIAGEDLSCLVWEECHRGVTIKMQQPVTPMSAPGVAKPASASASASASPEPTTTLQATTPEATTPETTTPEATTPETTTPETTTPEATTP